MNRIFIGIDASWVLAHQDAEKLPITLVADFFREKANGVVAEESFSDIIIDLNQDKPAVEKLQAALMVVLSETFRVSMEELTNVVSINIVTFEGKASSDEKVEKGEPSLSVADVNAAMKKESAAESVAEPAVPVMERIRSLRGAEQFISLCEEIQKMAPLLRQKGLCDVLTSASYIFSIDTGCGHTTALELFAELLRSEQLFNVKGEPVEVKLEAGGDKSDPLKNMLSTLTRAENKVVSIDITNWSDKVATPEFRDFLVGLQGNTDKMVYVFRLPYLEQTTLRSVEYALADVMRIRTVSFVPLTCHEVQSISEEVLCKRGFTATAPAWELFQHRLAEEKSDGRFYGVKTAYKIVDEMIYLKLQSVLKGSSVEDDVIEASELLMLTSSDDQQASAEELLNSLIGIDGVRERIYEIIGQIEYARSHSGVSAPAMHMRFIGNPGTGKTTVARIVGQLLKERGILSKGYFFEHAGGDFIGMYVGHTTPKTLALCRDAYGSVMFIDEAYTLADASYSNGDGYSKEAIDTLIAQMENHRDDMVVIMAGYPNEMKRLMALNPGLEGRMPYVLEFANYTREELAKIFCAMVEKSSFELGAGVQEEVWRYFAQLEDSVVGAADFSNARYVRNLFERTWSKTVMRAQLGGSDVRVITKEDFDAATAEGAKSIGTKQLKRSRPGYRLGLV